MPVPNECTPSTTWAYRKVKISRRLQGSPAQRAKRSSGRWLSRRDPKDRLSCVIKYSGGAEAWWVIEARGERYVAPGWMAIHDVFMHINDGNPGVSRGRQPK